MLDFVSGFGVRYKGIIFIGGVEFHARARTNALAAIDVQSAE